ncbi:peroxidasin-like protein [Stylophora pistillata]|uniref:peroxidasin-like protein n=1 Tax=Stylophora pistillata TaxID=50429 RepID=UPI000C04E1AC|nr:peroxidasin-like protein [Stylophora pistillata]
MLSPTTQTKDEGGSASFFCSADGNPPPKIQWRIKDSRALIGPNYSMKEDGTLIIKRLSYSDAGTYTCIATNILGSHSVSGDLVVRGLPVFTLVPPALVTPKELNTLRQSCQADGISPPVLSWRRSGMSFPGGKTVQSGGNRTISPIVLSIVDCASV